MGHILIVEDDALIRMSLSAVLTMEGHEVCTAENGLAALEYLRHNRPCLILLDLMMPIMDGRSFRVHQLNDTSLSSIPVAIMTGAHCSVDIAKDLQVNDLVVKPFGPERIYPIIEKHCGVF
jgi:CheY-like chemotaxis protein